MQAQWLEGDAGRWEGGRVKLDRYGKKVYVLEAKRNGARYGITLDVQTGKEASAELALFNRAPAEYRAAASKRVYVPGYVPSEGLCITPDLLAKYQADCLDESSAHHITKKWCNVNLYYLAKWMKALKGADLRKVSLLEYKELARSMKPRRLHISALRAFTHWLRSEGLLESGQDASRDLEVPQAKTKREQGSVGYTMEHVEKVYAALKTYRHLKGSLVDAQAARDVIALRALCGMHHTEVERLAKGWFKVKPLDGQGEIAGTVIFFHKKSAKTGLTHPQSLGPVALAAALRLQARGSAPSENHVKKLATEAAVAAGGEPMNLGELRHSFVTWSKTYGRVVKPVAGAGVSLEDIAAAIGHGSIKTTRIYDDSHIPNLIVLPLKLENEEDPAA